MICRLLIWGFALAYLTALALFLVGTFGLFGAERDPLSGVFLMPLGFPWTRVTGRAPESLRPWLAILTPAANLLVLIVLCRVLNGGRR